LSHTQAFLQDLAVIMLLAGAISILCNRLRQPVVLGYIAAGMIAGPYMLPAPLVSNLDTIHLLAELGVVFLLFSLGLEFSLKKLKLVGASAMLAAVVEIVCMLVLGYVLGRSFGWPAMDALFLGAMLAISSTTIIVKALDELGLKRQHFAQLIFGILIIEDILAIAILALLSGLAQGGSVSAGNVAGTMSRLGIFLVVALLLGLLLVPRLLHVVARTNSRETLLVTVLGLCFGFSLLVTLFGYSMALGAFLIGAIMAESRELRLIEHMIEPLREMFSAIFFVAVGMLVNPQVLAAHAPAIAAITALVIVGKIASCALGALLGGNDARTSLRVGMGMAQIGEFSFIIATLGLALNVISGFLYPVAVAVSALTTLATPWLIRHADAFADAVARVAPPAAQRALQRYHAWLRRLPPQGDSMVLAHMVQRILLHVLLNFCVVAAVFLTGAYLARQPELRPWMLEMTPDWRASTLWTICLMLALPFLVAAYRKLQALGLLLAELGVKANAAGRYTILLRRVLATALPVLSLAAMLLLISLFSGNILPPWQQLVGALTLATLIASTLWNFFVRWHSRLQIALRETLEEPDDKPR
jgi:CPA2 family monovalent cation:H+ antiporter-2